MGSKNNKLKADGRIPFKASNPGSVRESLKKHSALSSVGSGTTKPDDARNRESSGSTLTNSSVAVNLPGTEKWIPSDGMRNAAHVFTDSVLNLCMKSLISCSDNGFGELAFVDIFVRNFGLEAGKQWAEALRIPHGHSYHMLARLLYGPTEHRWPSRSGAGKSGTLVPHQSDGCSETSIRPSSSVETSD